MEDQIIIEIRENLKKIEELHAKLAFSIREIKYLIRT